jgi:4-hydroxybenzoate polyprenyltransferase
MSARPEFEPMLEEERVAQRRSSVLPWLRLMRLPNVFTAIADVAMGYLFVNQSVAQPAKLAWLIGASAALYTAGMVLNDVFDLKIDAVERPFRPLPSGQISKLAAKALGLLLLALGIVLGAAAGFLPRVATDLPWRSAAIAGVLLLCVLAYDGFLKRTLLGPLGMGACRFFNVLLGMSGGLVAANPLLIGFGPAELLAAAGIGTYIIGVTWFASREATTSGRVGLLGAMIVMACGVALLGTSARYLRLQTQPSVYWLLLALLMFTVLRRCASAVMNPSPQMVQMAVKHSILSLIWLDAATAVAVAGPVYGVAIAALLIPALLLGRWVYST